MSLRLSINKDVLILQYNVTIFQCYFTVHNIDLNLLNQSAVLSHICEIVNLTLIRFVRWRVISRAITWHTDVTDIWRSSSCLTVWAQCGLPTWFSVRKSGQCENLSSGRENVTFHVTWVIDMGWWTTGWPRDWWWKDHYGAAEEICSRFRLLVWVWCYW